MKAKTRMLGPATLALMLALMLAPFAAFAQDSGITDYDTDDDGLIEIHTVDQLEAVRYDLNGEGNPTAYATNNGRTWVENMNDARAAYYDAFPNPISRMGCPTAGCRGYELEADLDLSGNPNWLPLGAGSSNGNDPTYRATFYGNGHSISGLTISSGRGNVGLFSVLSSHGVIDGVHVVDPQITTNQDAIRTEIAVGALVGRNQGLVAGSSVRDNPDTARASTVTANRNNTDLGGLVGVNEGRIRATYVEGLTIRHHRPDSRAGGLVGLNKGEISASYARDGLVAADTSAVTRTANGAIGGLVGRNRADRGNAVINDSYAAMDLEAGQSPEGWGRLIGDCALRSQVNRSYYSSDAATGIVDGVGSYVAERVCGGVAKTEVELKAPTSYAGIYVGWHNPLDLNGDGEDDTAGPWHFGAATEWPTIRARDLDDDNDGLIEIGNLAQLDAIRYDPDGNGTPDREATAWHDAFATSGDHLLGCPATGCRGYELMANLDFDTDRDGSA